MADWYPPSKVAMISVPKEALLIFVERAKWDTAMMDTLSAEDYRKTLEAEIRLRQALIADGVIVK